MPPHSELRTEYMRNVVLQLKVLFLGTCDMKRGYFDATGL